MHRCSNWPSKLDRFIEERRNQPFHWERNNCAFFAADWVALLTGVDLACSYREQVTSARAAVKLMRRPGGVVSLATEALMRWNCLEVHVAYANRGDLVTTETKHGPAFGVFLGHCGAFAGPDGITFVPCEQLTQAWRIG